MTPAEFRDEVQSPLRCALCARTLAPRRSSRCWPPARFPWDARVGGDLVGDYCAYGAVSQAQLEGCRDHVTDDDVDARDTNAAQYARGELDECLADAGPFCEDR